jgi:Cdc6-like AAA superfamily ATPase
MKYETRDNPIKKKPVFQPSFGNRPEQLVGRNDVLDQLMSDLQSYPGSAERATLLVGQRGMGKTALLIELAEKAKNFDYFVFRKKIKREKGGS